MALCGYEFADGIICGQGEGHGPEMPHVRWGDGYEFREWWADWADFAIIYGVHVVYTGIAWRETR